MPDQLRKIKTIIGYTADARFYAEASDEIVGFVKRRSEIPSPYRYSPTHEVLLFKGLKVIHVETAHRRYEIFDVSDLQIFATEDEAMNSA